MMPLPWKGLCVCPRSQKNLKKPSAKPKASDKDAKQKEDAARAQGLVGTKR